MDLDEMMAIVRRDLHDEDSNNYRWTDDEIERHIAHAVKDYSEAVPCEDRASLDTEAGSREIDVSSLTDLIVLEAVEYPIGRFPPNYQRFSLHADTVTLLGNDIPDGSKANLYYGKLHTLDSEGSSILVWHDELIATGACGYAAVEWAVYAVNRVNTGGSTVPADILKWGKEKLADFRDSLKKLGRKNRVRVNTLYTPQMPLPGQSTDAGP